MDVCPKAKRVYVLKVVLLLVTQGEGICLSTPVFTGRKGKGHRRVGKDKRTETSQA